MLPDFYELTGGCIGVSDRARTCLEEVAAGQVDIIPLNILDKRGHALPDPYYWLNINMRNNSLTIGKGDLFMVEEEVIEDDGSTRKVKSLRFDSSNPHVYLELSRLKPGSQIWHETFDDFGHGSNVFISAHLKDELDRRALSGLVFFEVAEL